MEYPELDKLNCSNCTERSIEIHYPEFWKYIITNYHCEKWTERLYWFYHNLKDYPKCPICGKRTAFTGLKTGYREFCGYKCLNSSTDVQNRKKETSIRNCGSAHHMQTKSGKEKVKSTVREKYGVDNVFQASDFKDKRTKTNLEKYGCEHHMQNKEIKNKLINTQRKKNIESDDTLIGYTSDGLQIRKCPHKNCNKCFKKFYETPTNIYFDRKRLGYETCTKLVPIGNSQKSSLEYKICNLLDEYKIEYICRSRKITKDRKELDIFIPSYNLAIECNGIWSHSTINNLSPKPINYHIEKTKQCRKYNIEILHLWEDWILHKWDIVKSLLINKLKLTENTIYARNTTIKKIDPHTCNIFMDINHIQGKPKGQHVRYGLYYNDELVSAMTFYLNKNEWVLERFCNKLNTRVVGGASKLLNYFINEYNPEIIVSFSMNDISNGNLYHQLGFKTNGKITNSYWYIHPASFKRYHRSNWTKSEIVRKGIRDKKDSSWTEKQVMKEMGYFCIYDSGQMKWIWEKSSDNV